MCASGLHQTSIKFLLAVAAGMAFVGGVPASAEVVSFYFNGGVGVTILQNGLIQDAGLSGTDWLGRTVSATASHDPASTRHSVFSPAPIRHPRHDSPAYAAWMSLSIVHPDGSIAVLSPSRPDDLQPEIDEIEAFARSVERRPGDSRLGPVEAGGVDYAVLLDYAVRYPHPLHPLVASASTLSPNPVPQPSSLALCASGLFLAAIARCGARDNGAPVDHP